MAILNRDGKIDLDLLHQLLVEVADNGNLSASLHNQVRDAIGEVLGLMIAEARQA